MFRSVTGIPKIKIWALFLLACTLVLGTSVGNAAPIVQFFQGFEVNNVWGDPGTDPDQVATGTGGITSKSGSFHGSAVAGDFTRWGGYNATFPANGYSTSVDFYLNVAGGYANDTRFDWSSAISNAAGAHRRDFVITGGFYNAASPCGSGNRFVFSASNNSPGNPCTPALNPVVVTTSGWYSLVHTFLRGSGNVLVVKMELINSSNQVLGTWYRSDPTDVIGTTVGGNRYGWLVTSGFPFLAVDNSQRTDLDPPTTNLVVSKAGDNGWLFYDDNTDKVDPTLGSFVTGPGVTPFGTGSAQISVTGTERKNLTTYQFAGTPLAAIETLAFSTYNPSAGNGGSANRSGYITFNVDFNGSDTFQRRLNYVPSQNGTVLQNTWQEWDAINGGNAQWSHSGPTWPAGVGGGGEPGTTLKTWNQILSQYPGIRVRVTDAFFGIRVGEPYNDGYTENIDDFKFGTSAGTTVFDFDPASSVTVTPAAVPTALDNDYTRINNAVQAAPAGSTVTLSGTFNWVEPNAAASWALGSDGQTGTPALSNDDYTILPPANRNGITITAASLGAATIQGPGDLPTANLEGVFQYFNEGDNQNTTISNIRFLDFDLAIAMFNGAGGTDAYNGTKILNNFIQIAQDLNATAAPADVNQNIGIHYSFGINQQISGNQIVFNGDGVSNGANFSTQVGMQSNTSGGAAYEGLQITNNVLTVTNAQSANPQVVIGIWENGHAHNSNITVSGNSFTNLAAGNNRATNLQRAFRVTSHSNGPTNVIYQNNFVSGANIGMQWLAGQAFGGNNPVGVLSNTFLNNGTAINVDSAGSAQLRFNRIVGNGVGVNNATAGTVNTTDNWWGCNYGPGSTGAGCAGPVNGTSGPVTTPDWLILTTSASPTVIGLGDTSTVSSPFRRVGNVAPAGNIPNGVPVVFSGTLGTVSPTTGSTSGGSAGTTFFTATAFGSGGATTTVDGQNVFAPITITATCPSVSTPVLTSTTAVSPGVPVTIPVNTSDLTGRGIISADFTFTYNTSVLINPPSVTVTAGTVSPSAVITINELTPGTIIVSVVAPGSTPFSGLGTIANINLGVTGAVGSVSPLTLTNFRFNGNTVCSTSASGTLTVISGTVTGKVTYENTVAVNYPVPNVNVNAAGAPPVSSITNVNGDYSLTGFGPGAYTVTPAKAAQSFLTPNGIASNDPAFIAQHVVGLITLNSTQLRAANVSGLPTVSSFDAALIAQWLVGITNPINQTGTWKFTPPSTTPNTVAGGVQNYQALLMGDVNGDWLTGPAARPEAQTANAVRASLPTSETATGTVKVVPFRIDNLNGVGVGSYQFDVEYDPAVIEPTALAADITGTLSEGLFAFSNSPMPGLLKVVVFGAVPVNGDGVFVNLKFSAIGSAGTSSPLRIRGFRFNDGNIQTTTVDGQISIAASSDVSIRGRVLTPMGQGLRNTRVVLTNTTGVQTFAISSSFGQFEFGGLTRGETYTVSVQSKRFRFAPQVVSVSDSVTAMDLIAQD